MNQKLKSKKGITLIALIITVVVLIIITAVTINAVKSDGIIAQAKNAYLNYNKSEQNESESLKTYNIDKLAKENQENENTGGNYDGVCEPVLGAGMYGIYWDGKTEIVVNESNKSNWYNYKENKNNANDSKWANAKTSDGSYWVWIPKYEYKIDSSTKTIDINFISKDTTTPTEGYKIHPAFQNGTNNNFINGEWDKELAGIWVAKFEMSNVDASFESYGSQSQYFYGSQSQYFQSIPNVLSATCLTIGECYDYAYNYNRGLESHLMKNSEWGAVAYLAYSKYGRNGTKISVNNQFNYTGAGEGNQLCGLADYNEETFSSEYGYTTELGKLASTTGNTTGIYDLMGSASEYIAAYIYNGDSNLSTYGSTFANSNKSTKYATVYPHSSSDDSDSNYRNYRGLIGTRYGDALTEVCEFNDSLILCSGGIIFPSGNYPFFVRGNSYAYYGSEMFATYSNWGSGDSMGQFGAFRVVLAF